MKKFFDKIAKMAAIASILAMVFASMPVAAVAQAVIPRDSTGVRFGDVSFIGAKAGRVEYTTTATAVTTGSAGLLYALCAYGTNVVPTNGAMAWDTSVASTIANFSTVGLAISPMVFATNAAASQNGIIGCWQPPVPIRFENGLVVINSGALVRTLAIYRLDSGVNP